MTLEESIKSYENGVKIANKLYKKLSTLEGKIKVVEDEKEEDFGGDTAMNINSLKEEVDQSLKAYFNKDREYNKVLYDSMAYSINVGEKE